MIEDRLVDGHRSPSYQYNRLSKHSGFPIALTRISQRENDRVRRIGGELAWGRKSPHRRFVRLHRQCAFAIRSVFCVSPVESVQSSSNPVSGSSCG